jgi:hypothetical protein
MAFLGQPQTHFPPDSQSDPDYLRQLAAANAPAMAAPAGLGAAPPMSAPPAPQPPSLGQRIQSGLGALFPIDPKSGIDPTYAKQLQNNAILKLGLGMVAAGRQPGASFGGALASGLGHASTDLNGAMQTAYQNARISRAERRQEQDEERDLAGQAIPIAGTIAQHALALPPEQRKAYVEQASSLYKPAGIDLSGPLGSGAATDEGYALQLQRIAQFAPPRAPVSVAAGTSLIDPITHQPVYTAPGKVDWQDTGGEKTPVDSVTGQLRADIAPLKKTPSPVQSVPENLLSPEGLEIAAQSYYQTGKLPTGLGRSASALNAKIISRAAQIATDSGDDARSAVLNRFSFQATQKAQAETLKNFTSGKNGNTVRSLNVAVQHLDQLQQLGSALNNNDIPLLNKIGNSWTTQTGGAAPVTFNAMKKVVTDELVKAIVGAGGGVADREEMAATVNAAQSPAQLNDVIANYKGLMAGQLNGLRQQYKEGSGRDDFERFLLPITKQELERHEGGGPGAAPNPTAAPRSPAQISPTNSQGWSLHVDKNGNRAYVSPDGKQFQEVP